MKYIFLINGLGGGGAERVVSSLANFLSKTDEVSIYTIESSCSVYPLCESVKVRRLFFGRLSFSFFKLLVIPLCAVEFYVRRRIYKPDGCMSFLVRANFVNCLSAFWSKAAVISERNASDIQYCSSSLKDRVMRLLLVMLYKRAGRIVAISHGVKSSLVGLGIKPELISVIYNPLNDSFKLPSGDSERKAGSCFTLITVGRLIDQKNQEVLIRSVAILRDKGIDIVLKVLGEGPRKAELIAFSQKMKVSEHVFFEGFKSDVQGELKCADAFVFSSRFEGFGNVILEAMAVGLPVISTDCPHGPREIINPCTVDSEGCSSLLACTTDGVEFGEFGVLCPVGDAEGIALAVERLVSDGELYSYYSSQSIIRAGMFDIRTIAKQYRSSFGELR